LIENKKIRKRRRSSSECPGELIDTTIVKSPMPILLPAATQINTVVVNLRAVIDELDKNFASAKSLILELARLLDETKQGKQSQICAKIKEMLADKIKEGKITKKWIERCLPQEYRRRYVKSEQSSLSGKAKNLEKIMIVDNEGKTIAVEEEPSPYNSSTMDNSAFTQPPGRDAVQPLQKDTPNNLGISENDGDGGCIRAQEWEEAFLKALMMIEAEHLSGAEIKFTIPKERYEEVKTAMSNDSNCCYLIFDRNSGSFLRSESSEIGN
jgi:uncharacterized protein YnzC (UPF0291/DUF896 family)